MIYTDKQKEQLLQKKKDRRKTKTIESSGTTEDRLGKKRRNLPCGILLSLLLFVCLCGFCRNPVSVRAEELVDDSVYIVNLTDTTGDLLPKAEESQGSGSSGARRAKRSSGDVSTNWYGNQLTTAEREIYNGIAEYNSTMENYSATMSTDESGNITYSLNTETSLTVALTEGELNHNDQTAYTKAVVRAIHAYIRDYGEMYWITSFVFGYYTYDKTTGNITKIQFAPMDYYTGVQDDIEDTDKALQSAISAVSEHDSDYEIIEAAHDYVVELISYKEAGYQCHTITGGLLDKYEHKAVCECYAKLFRLLCVNNGIPCVLVTGGSETDSSGAVVADHMWNYVKLDGYWYLMDCTWDDTAPTDVYFLAGAETTVLENAKASEDHMPVGVFSSSILYNEFDVPTLAKEAYGVVQEISLNSSSITLDVGNDGQITATALPENATKGTELKYQSSNEDVATVDEDGTIGAVSAGTAKITVYSKGYTEISAVCTVTVQEHEWDTGVVEQEATCVTQGVTIYQCTHTGCGGTKTETISATGEHQYGEWIDVSRASDGMDGQQKRTCSVCENKETRSTFGLDQTEITLDLENTGQITALGASVTDESNHSKLSWSSADTSIATVSENGEVTAVSIGETKITAAGAEDSGYNGFSLICAVTVQAHSYKETTREAATCTTDGSITYTCDNAGCSATKTETLEATGHVYEESTISATCTTDGSIVKTCKTCREQETETIPATGHSYSDWTVMSEPTTGKDGEQIRYCQNEGCSVSETRNCFSIDPTVVTLDAGNTISITAIGGAVSDEEGNSALTWKSSNTSVAQVSSAGVITAVQAGEAKIIVTGDAYPGIEITCTVTVQDHTWDSGTVETAATCTTAGTMKYTCTNDGCSATTTGEIAALGHDYKETARKAATCTENGSITYTCSRCGLTKMETVAAATGHTGAWKTVKAATVLSTGLQEYRCTVCGKLLKSKTIAKLTAKVKLNVTSLPMQVKKSTTVLKVASMTSGDSVASWKSSNTKIVTVNSKTGKLTAKKKGTATITVTMKSGAKATCRITVQKGTVKTTKLTVKPASVTLAKGKSLTLTVTRMPLTSGQKVTYKSSNKKVATVNSKGKITAKKKGTAIITVTSGSRKKKINVTVK